MLALNGPATKLQQGADAATSEPVRTFQHPKALRPQPLPAEHEAWRDQLPRPWPTPRTVELLEGVYDIDQRRKLAGGGLGRD